MASSPITSWQIDGEMMETMTDFIFLGSKITDGDWTHEIKRCLLPARKAMTNLDRILKSRDITLLYSQSCGVPRGCMDGRVGRWRRWSAKELMLLVLEKTLESPLDIKEIKPVNPKGNQSWIFIERTDAESTILCYLLRRTDPLKDPDAGKDWRQEEKGMKENEMVGWYHQFNEMSLSKFQETVKDKEAWLCFSP